MAELTPEARAAIREAVEIVRADKQYQMLHDLHTKANTPPPNPTDPPRDPNVPPPPPAPPVDQPPPESKKKDAYWGELLG